MKESKKNELGDMEKKMLALEKIDLEDPEQRRERFYDTFLREQTRDEARVRDAEAAERMALNGPGKEGEDMTLEPIPKEERSAKLGEPGYNPTNENTLRRRYASKFHKNIYARWDKEKHKARRVAADAYFFRMEEAQGGFSFNAYEDSPPPKQYGPKLIANKTRLEAREWLVEAECFVGKRFARILRQAMVDKMTIAEIYYADNPLNKKSKRTAYRNGGMIVDAAFDKLAEFLG